MSRIKTYFALFKNRTFANLIITLLLGQIATAFLLLSLITEVFKKTGSNFGVSGVILSLSAPALLAMVFAGVISDLVDRKKIIVIANVFITAVVALILLSINEVFASITLSFLYFAGNSFFLPAMSAATAQVTKREKLIHANSLFFFALAGGQILGFFLGAVLQFFFGNFILLASCVGILAAAAILPVFLPPLPPRKKNIISIALTLWEIFRAFVFIFKAKTIWFFFVILAFCQGVVAFAATITPGFFDRVVGIPIEKSPLFIFPIIAAGIVTGTVFTHRPKENESFLVMLGFGGIGVFASFIGIVYRFNISRPLVLLVAVLFLLFLPFFFIMTMIASRTVLQRRIPHHYQGTVFGANFVLAAFFASVMSPLSATLVTLFGYLNVLAGMGTFFLVFSLLINLIRIKWKF